MRLIEFFEALIKQAGRKVFRILDNLSVHPCKPVKKWLAEHMEQIEVFYLPSDSPELNPDERLNGDLKLAIETRVPCRTKDKLRNAETEHMTQIENNPDSINDVFKNPVVACRITVLSCRIARSTNSARRRLRLNLGYSGRVMHGGRVPDSFAPRHLEGWFGVALNP